MARIVFSFIFLIFVPLAFAQEHVSQGLINSDQTYIVNDDGESIQEFGVGQLVYVVLDSKDSKDSKKKDFYRITFDPTNTKGDGWVLKDKVKLMTSYHSVDGKEPTEYENKPEPLIASKKTTTTGDSFKGDSNTEASTFLEELIKKDEQKPELNPVTSQAKVKEVVPKKDENNALQNDLEFLFTQQEGEFKETYKKTKETVKDSMQKKIGVSKFSGGLDMYANTIMDELVKKLQGRIKQPSITKIPYLNNLEDASSVKTVQIPVDLNGVFFGQMSPKIGDARLLKIKYYDQNLKQFTFEKVAKIPLADPSKTIETLANDCYQFLSK